MVAPDAVVLAVNIGSSSLKFGLYGQQSAARWTGQFDGLEPGGQPRGRLAQTTWALPEPRAGADGFAVALARLVELVRDEGTPLAAVSHRIVHGGVNHTQACLLSEAVCHELAGLSPLAPLHQPYNLAGVAACASAWPDVPQVGCFDTAFHAGMPAVEQQLPLPRALINQGLRRFGFHGLSYQYVSHLLAERCPQAAGGRALLLHLGNGASACATRGGRSVASSMGFSALDGLMMGTRSGSLDPGVLLHLWRQGWTLADVERLLYRESGLLGVSGLSADMRTLRASTDPAAQAAVGLFTHRVIREAGALVALLGGVDLLAFTGGIGEHDVQLRADVAAALGFAGVHLDPSANANASGAEPSALSPADSAVAVWVVPTDEGRMAARAAFDVLGAPALPAPARPAPARPSV